MTDDEFAATVAQWLAENLTGKFAQLKGKGGPGSEHEFFEQRLEWDKHLAASGWTCLGWPKEFGGRGASISQQVIFHQEYAKAGAPARVSHIGEELLGPTLIAYGTDEQKRRFLPGINTVSELWSAGLLRARRRFRPRERLHDRTPRRRQVDHQRPEGVDLTGSRRAVVLRGLPHRGGLQASPGVELPAGPVGSARCDSSAHSAAHRHIRVQRGLLRRRRHRCRSGGRGTRRGLEDRDGAAHLRARCIHARTADRIYPRAPRRRRPGESQWQWTRIRTFAKRSPARGSDCA